MKPLCNVFKIYEFNFLKEKKTSETFELCHNISPHLNNFAAVPNLCLGSLFFYLSSVCLYCVFHNKTDRWFSPSDQANTVVDLPPGGAKILRQPQVQLERKGSVCKKATRAWAAQTLRLRCGLVIPWYWASEPCCSLQGCTASEWAAQTAGQSGQRSYRSPVSETVGTHRFLRHHQWASPEVKHGQGGHSDSDSRASHWCRCTYTKHTITGLRVKDLTLPEWSGLMAMPKSVWIKVWLIRWVMSWNVFP